MRKRKTKSSSLTLPFKLLTLYHRIVPCSCKKMMFICPKIRMKNIKEAIHIMSSNDTKGGKYLFRFLKYAQSIIENNYKSMDVVNSVVEACYVTKSPLKTKKIRYRAKGSMSWIKKNYSSLCLELKIYYAKHVECVSEDFKNTETDNSSVVV